MIRPLYTMSNLQKDSLPFWHVPAVPLHLNRMGAQALCTTEEEVGTCRGPHILLGRDVCLSGGRQPSQGIWHLEFTAIKYQTPLELQVNKYQ